MVDLFDLGGVDPSSTSREAGEALTKARKEVEAKGIKSFLFHSSSPGEFDQRASVREVSEILDEVSDEYLGSRGEAAKLTAALRREFVAKGCESCPGGTKCVCDADGCRCAKESKVGSRCYSDHDEDIRTKGSCDYCGGTTTEAEDLDTQDSQLPPNCPMCRGQTEFNGSGGISCFFCGYDSGSRTSSEKADTQGTDDDIKCTCAIGGQAPLAHSPLCAKMRDSTQGKLWRKEIQPGHGVVAEKEGSKGAFAVCPTCEGQGSHVNPSIDSQGLSAEDLDEDPDFAEDYFGGAYDVPCAECGGQRVVPQCSGEGCTNPADPQRRLRWGDRLEREQDQRRGRDAGRADHYPTCYEHHNEEDRESVDSAAEYYAEMAAERRMGA